MKQAAEVASMKKELTDAEREHYLGMCTHMGFARADAKRALRASNNDMEKAMEYLFSGNIPDGFEADSDNEGPPKKPVKPGRTVVILIKTLASRNIRVSIE